ncbi:hypothetical protein ACQKDS_19075 [Serratia sp. NPDC078593]|uniref:hypothetical protein n=1 Tax=unclassified Serratia (in: enterobacteria) TaxID=2647522 RepID=UPI0037D65F78
MPLLRLLLELNDEVITGCQGGLQCPDALCSFLQMLLQPLVLPLQSGQEYQ